MPGGKISYRYEDAARLRLTNITGRMILGKLFLPAEIQRPEYRARQVCEQSFFSTGNKLRLSQLLKIP